MNNSFAPETRTVVTSSTKEALDFAYAMGLKNPNEPSDVIETPMDFAYAMGLRIPEKKAVVEVPAAEDREARIPSSGLVASFGMAAKAQNKE